MRRTLLVVGLVVGLTAVSPTYAAPKKKPITKTFSFTDPTPDPTGNTNSGNENHCSGLLPQETPYYFNAPAAGKLEVAISEFVGDWSLQIRDGSRVIGGADVNPPDTERAVVKLRKKGKIGILPCNLGGSPLAKGTLKFTYS